MIAPAPIAVLGAGAWGAALANFFARDNRRVLLWARDPDHVRDMRKDRRNDKRSSHARFEDSLEPTDDLARAAACPIVLAAVPAQAMRAVARSASAWAREDADWVICAKGFERGSHAFMTQVLEQEIPHVAPAVLSGPSFADDLSAGLPTAVALAAHDAERGAALCAALGAPSFRLYRSSDLIGAQIGGAAKNVLAIACGIAAGRGLGASAGAALTARGFAELMRFGAAMGAQAETLMGLSGLGDLLLSCSSAQSRNFSFGRALGAGRSLAEAAGGKLAEGAFTAAVLMDMARARNIDMPICEVVDSLVAGRIDVDGAIESLLARPQRTEF